MSSGNRISLWIWTTADKVLRHNGSSRQNSIILSDEILLGVASDLRRCPALDEVSRNAPPVPLQVSRVPGAQQVVNTLAYGGQVTLHCTLKTGRGTASPRALLPRGRQ
eukprot:6013255-Pyramimonas_sp.AAC.1